MGGTLDSSSVSNGGCAEAVDALFLAFLGALCFEDFSPPALPPVLAWKKSWRTVGHFEN